MRKSPDIKRILVTLLAFVLCLSAIGCGGTPVETTAAPETTLADETTVTTETTTYGEPIETTSATPEGTVPDCTVHEGTVPEDTAPEESVTTSESITESSPATESAIETESEALPETTQEPESTLDPTADYNINYNLDGGIDGGNPLVYNIDSEITLMPPAKSGYYFIGWTGSGLSEPTVSVKIEKGTLGDLSYTANWAEIESDGDKIVVNPELIDSANGVKANTAATTVSTPDMYGARGEGLYVLKTAYTDITVDGVKDNIYTYGLYFKSNIFYNSTTKGYYATHEVGFEIYMIRGQNGMLYVFADITDPTIIVNKEIFNDTKWHVDCLDLYYEFGNYGLATSMYSFVADPTGALKRDVPSTYKTVLTEKGYSVEFVMDDGGSAFAEGEYMSFQFFLNDTYQWDPKTNAREKGLLKHSSVLNPVDKGYLFPDAKLHDAIVMSNQSATDEVTTEKVEKTGDMLVDILSGASDAAFIYGKYATAQTIISSRDMVRHVAGKGGRVYSVSEDGISDSVSFDYKLYFGMPDHESARALDAMLGYTDYGVAVYEDHMVIYGWNEVAAARAQEIMVSLLAYIENGGKTSDIVGAVYTGRLEDQVGADVPKLEGFNSVTDVGEGAFQIYKLDAAAEEYTAYLALLEAAGYERYTQNLMSSVICTTYVSEDTVINAQYGGEGDKSIRIVVEPLSNTELPSLEKPADAESDVKVSSITMMAPQNLCLVIQLSNGHYIIVDSGNNNTQRGLSDFLRDNAPDRNNVVIEAWIFTHFHQDHIGGFVDYMGISSLTRYITVNNIIYNFPQEQVIQTAHKSPNDMNNVALWYNVIKPKLTGKGTTFYQARTGQKYYFGNAEIEILWTYDDIMPFNVFVDRSNPTNIGFSITIEGQKIMVVGDSSAEEFTMAYRKYGGYLKSDFVQLSHHGGGDGGSPIEFYQAVGAPWVFNPGDGVWYGDAERQTANSAEKLFIRDELGICTILLPYDGGEFKSEKGQ